MSDVLIRRATPEDFEQIWPIFREVVAAGDTYAFDRDTPKAEALRLWMQLPEATYVAEEAGTVLGTYYIKRNALGPGGHVCNCGYMVSGDARGRGLATAMCEHSQVEARRLGFRAMQFNLVVETNEGAVRLWRRLGFDVIALIPKAFEHPERGLVGGYVMYKWLGEEGDA